MLAFQRVSSLCLLSLVTWIAAATVATVPSVAQELREQTSLRFIPATASFYSAMFDADETYGTFFRSRAFAKLRAMPVVQQGLAKVRQEFETGELSEVREFFSQSENKEPAGCGFQ